MDHGASEIASEYALAVPNSKIECGYKVFHFSVADCRILETWSKVHEHGCVVAELANDKLIERSAQTGEAISRQFYIGSYPINISAAEAIKREFHDIYCRPDPEDRLPAHCLIVVRQTVEADKRSSKISSDRTQILSDLAAIFEHPHRHLCDCDKDYENELSGIALVLAKA